MMSPLVTLNRSSCHIIHRKKLMHLAREANASRSSRETADFMLGRPLHIAAGFADGRRGLVASHDLVDPEQVFRIVLALRLRLADKGRRHQLMIALAVIDP